MGAETFDFEFNEEDFSDFEVDIDSDFKTRYIKPPKTREISEVNLKYSDAKKLAKKIKITEGERYFVVVNGSFYFGDFIEAFITENNCHAQKMVISTLSMNENNVDSLANLLNGGFLDSLDLIVSDYFFSHERNNLIPYLYKELDKNNRFQLAVAGTHCKMCIFKTDGGKHIVIHGSSNLRSSGNIEQFVIEESKELYDFNLRYQKAIVDKYKTINKSIRGNELWKTVSEEIITSNTL